MGWLQIGTAPWNVRFRNAEHDTLKLVGYGGMLGGYAARLARCRVASPAKRCESSGVWPLLSRSGV